MSGSYFDALGPAFILGRSLGPGDQDGTSGQAAVLGYQAWVRLFDRDPAAVGREIDVNGHAFVVVGVLGPRFAGLHAMPRDLWLPLTAYARLVAPDLIAGEQTRALDVIVRLQTGVTLMQAQSAIAPTRRRPPRRRSATRGRKSGRRRRPVPLSLGLLALLSPVFVAFGLVLVAACANVSNVMLARAVQRQREIAVRVSLGASRGRIVGQLLTEGLLIAILAGFGAMCLTAWGLPVATTIFLGSLPPSLNAILRTAPLEIDHRVWLFAVAAGVVTTLAFALVPALQASRPTPMSALGSHGGSDRRGSRLRALLVASQVAIAVLLTIPALTLARNGAAMRDIDVGFEVEGVTSINVREGNAVDRIRQLALVMKSDSRFAQAAATSGNPLFGPSRTVTLESHGHVATMPLMFVAPEYFATLRIPIMHGRGFRVDGSESNARVAVVSAATASAFWPGQDPLGKILRVVPSQRSADVLAGYAEVTVVGTAGDIVGGTIVDGPEAGRIYLPTSPGSPHAIALLVRAPARDLAPEALQPVLQRAAPDRRSIRGAASGRRADASDLSVHGGVVDRIPAGCAGARVEHLWPLRRVDVQPQSTDPGDRHPHGARRDRAHDRGDGPATDRVPRRLRCVGRSGRRIRGHENAGRHRPLPGRVLVGRHRVRRWTRNRRRRDRARRLSPRPSRGSHRSGADAARRRLNELVWPLTCGPPPPSGSGRRYQRLTRPISPSAAPPTDQPVWRAAPASSSP